MLENVESGIQHVLHWICPKNNTLYSGHLRGCCPMYIDFRGRESEWIEGSRPSRESKSGSSLQCLAVHLHTPGPDYIQS